METSTNFDNSSNFTYVNDDGNCTIVTSDNILANNYFRTVVYTIYGFIFVVALLGNSSVCYIVLSSSRMRTVTNYFITNLAIGDLLITLLCVPFTCVALLNQYWSFGRFLCPLVAYSQALSVFVSAYTLVAISIDKYMVIMWPLKPRISKGCATSIIAVVWLIAAVTVLPTGLFTRLIQPPSQPVYEICDKYICTEDWSEWPGVEYGVMYTKILMVLQYVIPAIVLIFTYTSIAAVMWCHRIPGEAENSRDKRIARSKRKMIKMMVVVVFVYTLCWLPFNVLMIVSESVPPRIMVFLYFSLYGLAMSHAMYNPVIYCYMNTRFREGFRVVFRLMPCFRKCCRRAGTRRSCSSGYPHGGPEGTESTTVLHRNNTSTTYISLKRKCPGRLSACNYQAPVRSASLRNNAHHQVNGDTRRRQRAPFDVADEPI